VVRLVGGVRPATTLPWCAWRQRPGHGACGRCTQAQYRGGRDANMWARGYSAGRRGANSKFKWIQIKFKYFQILTDQNDLTELENFEIKYSFEGFEERNNFLHKDFFRFEMDFK
jgi:hypothetical protein